MSDLKRLVAEFVTMADLLIGKIEDALPNQEFEDTYPYQAKLEDLAWDLGWKCPPFRITYLCVLSQQREQRLLETYEPMGGSSGINLLESWPTNRQQPPKFSAPFLPEERHRFIANLRAWQRSAKA